MRTFSKSKIEYFEFQLEGDNAVYKIPLASSMPFSLIEKMSGVEGDDSIKLQMEILRKYMGDAADELTIGMMADIISAWSEASTAAGASLGES